jgi:hypothetical protein
VFSFLSASSRCTSFPFAFPICSTALSGQDSLLSIVQMPRGVPVACVAIDNAANAVRELRPLFFFSAFLFGRQDLASWYPACVDSGQPSVVPLFSPTPLNFLPRHRASAPTSLHLFWHQALLAIRMLGAAAAPSDAASSRLLDRMAAYQREQRDEVERKVRAVICRHIACANHGISVRPIKSVFANQKSKENSARGFHQYFFKCFNAENPSRSVA